MLQPIMDRGEISTTALWGEVNAHILGAARESPEEELEWEFFCECGRSDCQEHVVLSLEAYVAVHDAGEIVLAPGHSESQVERARRLNDDAGALRRQAELQVSRAKKNLRARREQ